MQALRLHAAPAAWNPDLTCRRRPSSRISHKARGPECQLADARQRRAAQPAARAALQALQAHLARQTRR